MDEEAGASLEEADRIKSHHLLDSFAYAFEGLLYVLRTQKHMRFHFVSAILALWVGFLMKMQAWEILILFLTIALVLIAEMFNTCLELTIDLITQHHHPLAKVVKDIAAAIVLVAAMNSLVVAAILILPRLFSFLL